MSLRDLYRRPEPPPEYQEAERYDISSQIFILNTASYDFLNSFYDLIRPSSLYLFGVGRNELLFFSFFLLIEEFVIDLGSDGHETVFKGLFVLEAASALNLCGRGGTDFSF